MPTSEQAAALQDYRELKRMIGEKHLLDSQPLYYTYKTITALATVAAAVVIAVIATNPVVLMLDALFLAFGFTQMAFLGHDIGHRQGFRGRRTNKVSRLIAGCLALGISHSWWNDKHNLHHAAPNHIDIDPDIQYPFLAFAQEQLARRAGFARKVVAFQAYVFPLLLPFQAINMRITSIRHLREPKAKQPWLQAAMIAAHLGLYVLLLTTLPSVGLAIAFAVVHHAAFGIYNSSVFASNHKGMPVIDENTRMDFLREQVLTSRNVTGSKFIDFWCGGLNLQIEHHLFPTMPRNNLRKAQPIVEQFCKERGISYEATSLGMSYVKVLSHLNRVGSSLRGRGPKAVAAVRPDAS